MATCPKTWVEVSASALKKNVAFFRKQIGDAQLMSIIKSNAYGHGLGLVSQVLKDEVDWFGVDSLEEGMALRKQGIDKPVLILGHIPYACFEDVIDADLSFVISSKEALEKVKGVKKNGKKAKLHFEIETGLHRQGVEFEDLQYFTTQVKESQNLVLEGMMMHFANVEQVKDRAYSQQQVHRFHQAVDFVYAAGLKPAFFHAACSAAVVLEPDSIFNLVRMGIGQYGLWSSEDMREKTSQDLIPALTWKTMVAQVKMVKAGESISYGLTENTVRDSRIAVLPIGYWDGFDRMANSSKGYVLIKGKRCKVLGRVCMNMTMVDITDIQERVEPEDEVVLIGKQGNDFIPSDEVAQRGKTIHYEIVTRINPLLPRILVD